MCFVIGIVSVLWFHTDFSGVTCNTQPKCHSTISMSQQFAFAYAVILMPFHSTSTEQHLLSYDFELNQSSGGFFFISINNAINLEWYGLQDVNRKLPPEWNPMTHTPEQHLKLERVSFICVALLLWATKAAALTDVNHLMISLFRYHFIDCCTVRLRKRCTSHRCVDNIERIQTTKQIELHAQQHRTKTFSPSCICAF